MEEKKIINSFKYKQLVESSFGDIISIKHISHALTNKVYIIQTKKKKMVLKEFKNIESLNLTKNIEVLLLKYFSAKNITPDILLYKENEYMAL